MRARGGGHARAFAATFALAALAFTAGPAAAGTFTYSGDSVKATLAKGSERAVLTGNAKVRSDDMLIAADEIQLIGKDFTVAIATGTVHVVDAKRGIDLTSTDLTYDRDTKISRVRGNAVMADLKNEIVVKGGFIEDRDKEGLTIIQIGVRIFRKDMVCRSEFAKYWRDRKVLELTGMPWVSRKGDEYRATKITIDLDTEEIVLEGDVQGKASTEEEKTPADTQGAPVDATVPEGTTAPGSSGGGSKTEAPGAP